MIVTDEDYIAVEIPKFWGKLFCVKGNASLNIKKIMVDDGMICGGEDIYMRDLECAIKDMKEGKATDENCLISEYPNALKDGSREE